MKKILSCFIMIYMTFLTSCSFSLDPLKYSPERQHPNSVWECEELPITAYFADSSGNSIYANVMVYTGNENVCFFMGTVPGWGCVSADFQKYKKTNTGFVADTDQYLFGGEVVYQKDKFIIKGISCSNECFLGDCDTLTVVYKEDYTDTMKDILMQHCNE